MNERVLKETFEKYYAELPCNFEEMQISSGLEQKMMRIFSGRKRVHNKWGSRTIKRVASFAAAILMIVSVMVLSVDGLREGFAHFILVHFRYENVITFGSPTDSSQKIIPKTPSYIPSGFEQVGGGERYENDYGEAELKIVYQKNQSRIVFQQLAKGASIWISIERGKQRRVDILGKYEGVVYAHNTHCQLVFNDGEYMYGITADLPPKELIKIAESIFEKEIK